MAWKSCMALMGAAMLLSACEPAGAPPPEMVTVRSSFHGAFYSSPGQKAFYPDTGEGPWWVALSTPALDVLEDAMGASPGGSVSFSTELSFEGRLDEAGGRFGPAGAYSGEVLIRDLTAARRLERAEFADMIAEYAVVAESRGD